MADVKIDARPNGPYVVTGSIELRDTNGNVLPTQERTVLCRCGASTRSFVAEFGIRRPRSASRAAQNVAQQSENAPVSASAASAVTLLPQHRAPTRSEWPLQR
jgi:hypothetical protein